MAGDQCAKIKNAFTLIEMLVVISVVAILISLLLPSLSKARESAQAVQCGANLHQLGVVFTAYTNEHDGWLMPYVQNSEMTWFKILWDGGYIPKPAEGDRVWSGSSTHRSHVIKCPGIFEYDPTESIAYWDYNASYVGNRRLVGTLKQRYDDRWSYGGSIRPSELGRPSELVHFIDHDIRQHENGGSPLTLVGENSVSRSVDFRHLNATNYLTYGGNIANVTLKTIMEQPSSTSTRWLERHVWRSAQ